MQIPKVSRSGMAPTHTNDDEKRRGDIASYSAELILDLRNLAKSEGFKTLQSVLELAYYEASSLAHPVKVTAEEIERLKEMEKAARLAEAVS
jgi:hypothetical protein